MSMADDLRNLVRLGRDRRGVSAVEFALIAPVLIGLYFGSVETVEGVAIDRKVSLVAAALANLTAQVSTIKDQSAMDSILNASTAIMSPYSANNLKITVSCIKIDANKNATVKWSVTRSGTPMTGSATLPSALQVANTQIILAQVSYAYTPTVGYNITGTINLSDKMYMAPRISAPSFSGTTCT